MIDIEAWALRHGIRFVQRSHGEYTTGTVSRDALLELARAERAEAAQPHGQHRVTHVGESHFEGWFAGYAPAGKGDKQRARDAYAAGMEEAAQRVPLTIEQINALPSAKGGWRAIDAERVSSLIREVEAAHGIAAVEALAKGEKP